LQLLVIIPAAFAFARIEFPGRDLMFVLVLAALVVPGYVTSVPNFLLLSGLRLTNTYWALVLPFVGSAFGIFLLRQFFMGIPKAISEAARIDGCSELRIWAAIILPLAKPALAVVALFQFIYNWNDFLAPLLFLTRPEDFTLALGLQVYQSQNGGTQLHLLMAASVLACLPILLLFFFAQKTFIQGIAVSGLKE